MFVDPFFIYLCIVDVTNTSNMVQTKDGNLVVQKVEKLWVDVPIVVSVCLATKKRQVTSRKVCGELIEGGSQSKVLAPQLSESICIGVNIISITLIPVIVSWNYQEVGGVAE